MLSGFLGVPIALAIQLEEPVDIEMAADELSELQRQEVSVEADLDAKAPVFRVLDFLEEVFLIAASGDPLEESLLVMARRLLEDTSDVIGILDTLRFLVSDGGVPARAHVGQGSLGCLRVGGFMDCLRSVWQAGKSCCGPKTFYSLVAAGGSLWRRPELS